MRNAADLQTDAGLSKALIEITPAILVEAVDELLMVQRGRELGIKFGDDKFKEALDNIKKENKLDDAGLAKALQQEGLTLQELRQNLERSWLQRGVQQQEIMPAMNITEEEKRQYYAAHPTEFMTAATVTVRELFMAVPSTAAGVSVGIDEEVKEKILAVRERARKGEDYAKLVGELSEAGSKANGGLIPNIVVTDLSPALNELLGKLKPGDISEPLRTSTGYVLFKLESRSEATPEPFAKVRDAITAKIYESRMEGEQRKFLERLRTQALIEWKDDRTSRCTRRPARRKSHLARDEDRLPHPRASRRHGSDGGHDGYRVSPAGEAHGRVRARRQRDGQLGRAGARDRSDARIRRVHRGRTAGVDSDLRRRSAGHGGRGAGRRRHGRRHRRYQHGLPGAEDREAQRRVQPDARAGARGQRGARDGQGGADSGDGEDARRLEPPANQRPRAGADGSRCRGRSGGGARPHRGAVLHRRVGLEPDWRDRVRRSPFRCSVRAIAWKRRRS